MKIIVGSIVGVGCLAISLSLAGPPAAFGEDQEASFENLQVLPEEIPRQELLGWMFGNLRGLGLPRMEGRGCLHCHVGDLETPRHEWDYASDEKEAKRVARRMMAMVIAINETHLADLEGREETLEVTCATCHAGRVNPRPLDQVLMTAYQEEGVEGLLSTYDDLRAKHFGGNAYDFRVGTLAGVSNQLARRQALGDAIVISTRNEEAYPSEPSARRTTNGLRVWQAIASGGTEAGITEFRRLKAAETPDHLTYRALDSLGWGIFRTGQHEMALALFEENRTAFPTEYVPLESLTDARLDAGMIDVAEAIRLYQEWLEGHPDQDRARNRITNLQADDS